MIKQLLLVGLGGGIGSMLRFLVSRYLFKAEAGVFPWPTFLVNLLGCLLIGVLIGLFSRLELFDANLRALLVAGFCGGFTTFSAFSLENVQLWQSGHYGILATYMVLSIALGMLFVFIGLSLSK